MIAAGGPWLYMQPMVRKLLLHDEHERLGADFLEKEGIELVGSYGAWKEEYLQLTQKVGVADLSYRGLLRIVGPEAASYLHGMVTSEVEKLGVGEGNLTTVVHARGRMLGDGRIFRVGESEFWMDLPGEAREAVRSHLDQYLISEDCEVQDITEAAVRIGAWGPRAARAIEVALDAAPPTLGVHRNRFLTGPSGGVLLVGSELFGLGGYEIFLAPDGAEEGWKAIVERARAEGGGPVGDEALEALRIQRGIPRWGRELAEDTIPLEANLKEAISYTKGCYVGQEVIAKATYRGAVRRRLVRMEVSSGAKPGAALTEGEKQVGRLTSVLDPHPEGGASLALGYLRRDRLEVGRVFPLEGGGEAKVIWVPEEDA